MAALKLSVEMFNTLLSNQDIYLGYSVGYYETKFLISSLNKSGISCSELSVNKNENYDQGASYNAFIIEPNKADLTLEKLNFDLIEELVDIKKNKLKVIILDISYQGSFLTYLIFWRDLKVQMW